MKKSLIQPQWGGLIGPFCVCLFFVGTAAIGTAAQIQQAHVSQVIQEVRLLEAQGAPRPAAAGLLLPDAGSLPGTRPTNGAAGRSAIG